MMILFVTGTCFLASVIGNIYVAETLYKRSKFDNYIIERYCALFMCMSTIAFSSSIYIVLT